MRFWGGVLFTGATSWEIESISENRECQSTPPLPRAAMPFGLGGRLPAVDGPEGSPGGPAGRSPDPGRVAATAGTTAGVAAWGLVQRRWAEPFG